MAMAHTNLPLSFRSPRRVTVTLPLQTYEQLQLRCDSEGRSLSNLAAFLLEMALQSTGLRASGSPSGPAPRPRF